MVNMEYGVAPVWPRQKAAILVEVSPLPCSSSPPTSAILSTAPTHYSLLCYSRFSRLFS